MRLVMAADRDPDQLSDAARHRGARVGQNRVGAGGSADPNGQGQQRHPDDPGGDAARDQAGPRPPVGALPALDMVSRGTGANGCAEYQRQQGQERVQSPAQDEREDAERATAAEPDAVHQRTGSRGADEFEDGREDDRRHKHRPAIASPPAAQSTHGETDRDRRQRLDSGDRSAGRPPTGQYTPPASHGHRGCQRPQSVTMQSLGWRVGTANLRGGGNHEDTSPRRPRVRPDKLIIIGPPLLSLSDLTPRRPGTNVPRSLPRISRRPPRR